MTPFGTKVREYRATKGIMLKKMAEDLGVTAAEWCSPELRIRSSPTFVNLKHLAYDI